MHNTRGIILDEQLQIEKIAIIMLRLQVFSILDR